MDALKKRLRKLTGRVKELETEHLRQKVTYATVSEVESLRERVNELERGR